MSQGPSSPQDGEGTDGTPDGPVDGASPPPGQGRSRSSRRRRNRRARQRAERAAASGAGIDHTTPDRPADGSRASAPAAAAPDTGAAPPVRPAPPVHPAPAATPGPPASRAGDGPKPRPGPRPTHRLDGSTSKQSKSAGRKGGGRRGEGTSGGSGGAGSSAGSASGGRRRGARRWMRQVDEFSAGGLVLDLTGDVPLGALIGRIDRQGRLLWSLPKGHIEAGETAEQAAVREVEEETGIAGVIIGELGVIDFWFVAEGRRIHKTVRHYLMRRTGGELSDTDIEVDEVAWVPLPRIRERLAYPDERGLVDTAGRMLAESA
ncbi:NUDIX hydrolase [Jatrophihabitans fulvus]